LYRSIFPDQLDDIASLSSIWLLASSWAPANGFRLRDADAGRVQWFPDRAWVDCRDHGGSYGASAFILGLFVPNLIASIGGARRFQILAAGFFVMGNG